MNAESDYNNIASSEITRDIIEATDFRMAKEVNKALISRYPVVAFPVQFASGNPEIVRYAHENDMKVYIYGSLTINDYKNIANMQRFGIYTVVKGVGNPHSSPH
jgi:hypothetical protein